MRQVFTVAPGLLEVDNKAFNFCFVNITRIYILIFGVCDSLEHTNRYMALRLHKHMRCVHVACTLVFGAHTEAREGHRISPLLSVFYF